MDRERFYRLQRMAIRRWSRLFAIVAPALKSPVIEAEVQYIRLPILIARTCFLFSSLLNTWPLSPIPGVGAFSFFSRNTARHRIWRAILAN
ncbi:hypothetical protein B0H67DRAFT_582160 [Lasiosphaeris hirsuta]|uniref:Uncharacterized protein n=1 Tax=Lasiosphaeris hirsuta TaxID=260670 RepID=A0AA40AHM0_9PEZI|nr:hypothetical protein B0H67DRAFT_582160 [Lasiosphaeris hirsuta]